MIKIEINENNKYNNQWHSDIIIRNGTSTLYLSTNPSGCGQMILHGWAWSIGLEPKKESLKYILDIIQNKRGVIPDLPYASSLDIGSIITTVGDGYYGDPFIKVLDELGFKNVAEYRNPRHGRGDSQRLYIWTIK